MNGQTGRFVDHYQVEIFVQDWQSDGLWHDFDRSNLRLGHRDPIPYADTLAYADFLGVETNVPGFNQALHSYARQSADPLGDYDIKSLSGVGLIRLERFHGPRILSNLRAQLKGKLQRF